MRRLINHSTVQIAQIAPAGPEINADQKQDSDPTPYATVWETPQAKSTPDFARISPVWEHRSRVGVSLLTAVGLESLLANDRSSLVRIASSLAADTEKLQRLPGEALINSSLNYQSTPNNSNLEKVSFLFCFIFNDLQSLKMTANIYKNWPYAAETLNKSEFP